jgi:hypothetical protein
LSAVRPYSSPCSTFLSTSEPLTSSPTCLYQKDERALPGDLRSCKFILFSPLNIVSQTTPPPPTHTHTLFFSLFVLQRVNNTDKITSSAYIGSEVCTVPLNWLVRQAARNNICPCKLLFPCQRRIEIKSHSLNQDAFTSIKCEERLDTAHSRKNWQINRCRL